ncbi:hypothetical protein FRC03_005972 [Tulasnella sp. 419]|nr:hypothetical protein FRC02_011578 [Tulasnella sp. 418]KAG8968792.1 hypothetical protein FRC03_005972 [Tulasnella sp. 419]
MVGVSDDPFMSSPARPARTSSRIIKAQPLKAHATEAALQATRKNPLKRTASAALLLTPPATIEKQHRSKQPILTDDEEDGEEDGGQTDKDSPRGSPRRRSGKAGPFPKLRRNERRFSGGNVTWAASSNAEGSSPVKPSASLASIHSPKRSPRRGAQVSADAALAAEHVDRMNLDSESDASPVLPTTPKMGRVFSHVQIPPPPQFLNGPTTPTRKSTRQKKASPNQPTRDSPNNPFLKPFTGKPPPKQQHSGEQPTMTYVFRGVKAVFRNPAYGLPEPVEGDPSTLPPEHPDFSPNLLTAPRLLFPPANIDDADSDVDLDADKYKILTRSKAAQQKRETSAPATPQRPSKKRKMASSPRK